MTENQGLKFNVGCPSLLGGGNKTKPLKGLDDSEWDSLSTLL